jgi:hypothetical protein
MGRKNTLTSCQGEREKVRKIQKRTSSLSSSIRTITVGTGIAPVQHSKVVADS